MQFDSGTEGPGAKPQGIPLAFCPGAPFDDYRETEPQEILRELPLQRFDLPACIFALEVGGENIQPVVGTKANRPKPLFQRLGQGGLTRARQAAHQD